MKDIIVVGGGGFAKEVIWLADDCNRKVRGVLDDNVATHGLELQGTKVLGKIDSWKKYASDCEFIIAIGNPRVRKLVTDKMKLLGKPKYTSLIHPSVHLSNTVKISEGAIICAGAILTTDIELGEHCILNLNVTVGHECDIKDFVTIAPMAAISGNVTLNTLVEVGTGAVIRQGLTLETGSMLGMGGVLTKNIPERFIFAGNPAKKLKEIVE
ncbi:acetyltransferase [Pseudoalteromonas sp. Angola-7]|uniref:acetyltransferase n=1 Tax=Pseudoalteromonas sp. Angola-7 TaxID=3025336 RepID=UPI00235818F4|nr:acetyltransferase [Pseudoalteromonas sp. Angola-7]MDC9529669.1 acetyltransferase [Pseudoalteromonas sp. Angola-7]